MLAYSLLGPRLVRRRESFPSVVYNCCYGRSESSLERLANEIGRERCFNCRNQLDKWRVHLALGASPLHEYLPKTHLLNSADLDTLLRLHGSLILKPRRGSHGQGVHLVDMNADGTVRISEHSIAPHTICRERGALAAWLRRVPRERYLLQQPVQLSMIDGRCFDLRVLVQKGSKGSWGVTNVIARIAWSGYFNTSMTESIATAESALSASAVHRVESQMAKLHQVGAAAAAILEERLGLLGEVSVDCALDRDGRLWIIEVNGRPDKSLYSKVLGLADPGVVYRRSLEYAEFLLSQPR